MTRSIAGAIGAAGFALGARSGAAGMIVVHDPHHPTASSDGSK